MGSIKRSNTHHVISRQGWDRIAQDMQQRVDESIRIQRCCTIRTVKFQNLLRF